MTEDSIFRQSTELEKQNFVELTSKGNRDLLDEFMTALVKAKTKFLKEYKPYDNYGARMDFEEDVKAVALYNSNTVTKAGMKTIKAIDFDLYGKPDRFELVEVKDVTEEKIAGNLNTRIPIVTGKQFDFRSKERGNGISIFVPEKELTKVLAYYRKHYEIPNDDIKETK